MRSGWWVVASVLLAACSSGEDVPGKASIGTYAVTATQTSGSCALIEQPDGGFTYTATLTYDPGTTHGYLTVNEVSRDAGFDGRVMDAPATAKRVFNECSCGDNVVVNERIVLALLSDSQRTAVGGDCPPNPLDGGVPAPNDAGIVGPALRGDTYDAPLACGEQTDQIVPGSDCTCDAGCTLHYALSGVRQ